MDTWQTLEHFLETAREDGRLGPTHVTVYLALLQQWRCSGGKSPIRVSRAVVMKAAKIRARHTYHKVLRELHGYGYIRYTPSSHPLVGSTIYLNTL